MAAAAAVLAGICGATHDPFVPNMDAPPMGTPLGGGGGPGGFGGPGGLMGSMGGAGAPPGLPGGGLGGMPGGLGMGGGPGGMPGMGGGGMPGLNGPGGAPGEMPGLPSLPGMGGNPGGMPGIGSTGAGQFGSFNPNAGGDGPPSHRNRGGAGVFGGDNGAPASTPPPDDDVSLVDRIAGNDKDAKSDMSLGSLGSTMAGNFAKLDDVDKAGKDVVAAATGNSNSGGSEPSAGSTATSMNFGDFDLTPLKDNSTASGGNDGSSNAAAPKGAKAGGSIDVEPSVAATGASIPAGKSPLNPKSLPRKPLSNHALSKLFDEELKDLGKM